MATDSIVSLIDTAYVNLSSEWGQQWRNTMSPGAYRQEMKTVTITMPRAMGHTSAAIKILQKYSDAHLLYAAHHIVEHTRNTIREMGDNSGLLARVHRYSTHDRSQNENLCQELQFNKSIVVFDAMPHSVMDRKFRVEYNEYQHGRPKTIHIDTAFEELITRLDDNTELFVYLQGGTI